VLQTQVQVPTPPPEIPDWVFHRTDPMDIAIAVVVVLGALGCLSILWMLARGWMRRWTQPAIPQQAFDELRESVRQLSAEVGELHERLDFAERVLSARREAERIEGRGH
jgi:hypothetical protein